MKITILTLVVALCCGVSFAQNQTSINVPTLSPLSEVKQEVALTEVKLTYSRPSAKGRKIFGGLVPFGEVWRTGANASTKLTFSEDVKIAGNALKAGTYAFYTIPGPDDWTIIIHNNITLRALNAENYKPENDAFRFKVKPSKTDGFVETFTIGFSDIETSAVNIELSWENTSVKFGIAFDVDSQVDKQIAEIIPAQAAGDPKAFNLFRAAEYYLHNDRDLKKALGWIDEALDIRKEDPRFGLLKAKILHKKGDKAEALKVIAAANAWAKAQNNANYTSQTQIFWDEIK
ncbi:MAG: DUF2911 domain-containing protein [Acidobacteriota bacterium]|nr:DUF2911 domain-containing protein [Acidobacteriota bacterium]MDH3528432.1 DUF2911 domain-containing protein [Acidobacteriota bacterium]